MQLRPNAFATFFFVSFGINFVLWTFWIIGDVVWVDFLHINPGRTHENAAEMIALSPIYGLSFALISLLPTLIGAIGAAIDDRLTGSVSLWVVLLLIAACGVVSAVQNDFIFPCTGEFPCLSRWSLVLRCSAYQLPALLGSYAWLHYRSRSLL